MFEIRRFYDKKYQMIVVATGYSNPLSCLSAVAKRLESEAFKGDVLFDLLCSNGFESNRFASISFDGKSFARNTFSVIDEHNLPNELVKKQNTFLSEHSDFLSNSVLSRNEVSRLTAGI
ncbi:hypothetical protein BSQ98_21155 [Serratia liquefaciens]|uniref:type II toxin-antitoxin system RnlB family antitoxin n=2 Tax=Serratia TaxID=613 RepID=UPI001020601B|nr:MULTISPECIES: type II toxin-antitoxin system RnlB family antitoxin [Serratia]RYM59473.1 hypothetical protein BSQ98_21155 [Serratia liquefaciens]